MKTYLLSVCYPERSTQSPPDALRKIMMEVRAVEREMRDASIHVFSGGLQPPDTTRVLRQRDSKFVTTDGPFIESKELVGGITIPRAADLDAVLAWGRKLAHATTPPTEVRPFFKTPG